MKMRHVSQQCPGLKLNYSETFYRLHGCEGRRLLLGNTMLWATFKFWIIAPFGFSLESEVSESLHKVLQLHVQEYCTDVNEIRKTWTFLQQQVTELVQTLLSRCSCHVMRSTHTHTHRESFCSISCRPSVHSTVLLKRHEFLLFKDAECHLRFFYLLVLPQGCPILFLEIYIPAEFRSNPPPTHVFNDQVVRKFLIRWFRCVW